jgi:trehalose-6-phosphate synthase
MLAVEHRDRRVLITISHLGVDPRRLDAAKASPESVEVARAIRAGGAHPDEIVFGSLDELQRLRGVPLKLLAFERLLSTTSRWHGGRARFVLWTMKKGVRQEDVQRSTAEVRILVDRINAVYGPVVELREFDKNEPPTLKQRAGLWLATDVVRALRSAMQSGCV